MGQVADCRTDEVTRAAAVIDAVTSRFPTSDVYRCHSRQRFSMRCCWVILDSMEKEFIDWLIESFGESQDALIGIGDDAAVFQVDDSPIVVTTDTISDGTHFDSATHSLEAIGHKAIAVSLSDIAAMGARPIAATVNFTSPQRYELPQLQSLFKGMWETAAQYGVKIVGGDTNRWSGGLVVGSTLIGSKYEESIGGFWKIAGGRPGDQILVTGVLGGSILRKHIEFSPRLDLAANLATKYQINAATDITDSLTLDLATVAKQSNCGFWIDGDSIPVADDAHELSATTGKEPLEHALYDGEDFELLFCVSNSVADEMLSDPDLRDELCRIGELTQAQEFMIKDTGDQKRDLQIRGFEH